MDYFVSTKANTMYDSKLANSKVKAHSIFETMSARNAKLYVQDAKVHDANFGYLTSALGKLYQKLIEPKYYVTYQDDMQIDVGGGFVDYVQMLSVDWASMSSIASMSANNANIIPRINAGLSSRTVNVYTYELAYDLRFIELEKLSKVQLNKSIEEIYSNAIIAAWDLFVQNVAYLGANNTGGLFTNDDVVSVTTIDNSATTGDGFEGIDDSVVVSFFNGVFETYLSSSNMNLNVLPDTILVPTFVGADLTSRFSSLYTNTLRRFIIEHNLAVDEIDSAKFKLKIASRPQLNELGTASAGRIVVYRNEKDFVRLDMPYPMQHYITLPNIDKMSYTSSFVGQVSDIQMPYNTSSSNFGAVTYWDFTTTTSS